MYDLNTFSNVIIYCGGNDAANKTDIELFEERYDQLLTKIEEANSECRVYICSVAPRGDVNVDDINNSIDRLAVHRSDKNVESITDTNGFFIDNNEMVLRRYYNRDHIHLAHPGTKRLLHAKHNQVAVVENYDTCVFVRQQRRFDDGRTRENREHRYVGQASRNYTNRGSRQNGQWNNMRSGSCYYCGLAGHKIADCPSR